MKSERLLDLLYGSVSNDDLFPDFLVELASTFECKAATLLYMEKGCPAADVVLGHGLLDEAAQRRYRESYASDDPAPAAMAKLSLGAVVATDRIFSRAFIDGSRFIREFYFPLGLREAMGGPITADEKRLGILAVQRGPDRPPFSDGELARFATITRHAARAMALRQSYFAFGREVKLLAAAANSGATALLIYDETGRLAYRNEAAAALLRRGDGLSLAGGNALKALDERANARLAALFRPGAAGRTLVLQVPREGSERPYILKADPIVVPGLNGIRVRVCDLTPAAGSASQLLADIFQMSAPCARLVSALIEGHTIASYAKRNNLSPNTVKFHLKGAFLSTFTNRQADLIRVSLSALHDLSPS